MKGYVFTRRWVEDCQVRLWSAQGKVSEIARWIRETDLCVDDQVSFRRELEHIILARALVAVGREQAGEPHLDRALDLLARLLEMAESRGWMGKAIEILVLQALAWQAQGRPNEALTALERALSLGEPEGYVRTFVDEGAPLAQLLSEAVERGIAPEYVHRLLVVFGKPTKDEGRRTNLQPPSFVLHPSSVVEPLSERELEVLQLIAEGLTNREIADRLFLALSTVKVHTRNIYGKLNVHSRTQALTRARDLDML
jgi:LuxR family maltose regulon positive regulatory protein